MYALLSLLRLDTSDYDFKCGGALYKFWKKKKKKNKFIEELLRFFFPTRFLYALTLLHFRFNKFHQKLWDGICEEKKQT